MKIRQRTLAKLGLFLLAGAVVNVGVAWGCHWWLEEANWGHHGYGYEMAWPMHAPSHWPAPTRRDWIGGYGKYHISHSAGPTDDDWSEYSTHEVFVGFPAASLHYRVSIEHSEQTIDTDRWRWYEGAFMLTAGTDPLLLPYAVNWRGFIANLVIFGIATLAIVGIRRGSHRVRRRLADHRLARGLCPRCRYDICDLEICPECGTTIRRKAAAP